MQITSNVRPMSRELYLKLCVLKSIMYAGIVWGLYHQGWAIMRDQDDFIFPFWLNAAQAQKYAQSHWPQYEPCKISLQDFKESLLPTLSRLKVIPALCHQANLKFKFNTQLMHMFFFQNQHNVGLAS